GLHGALREALRRSVHGAPAGLRRAGPDGERDVRERPRPVKAVFTGVPELARVFDSRQTMAPVLGLRSILLVDGTAHLRSRKLMRAVLRERRPAHAAPSGAELASAQIDRWPTGRVMTIQRRM